MEQMRREKNKQAVVRYLPDELLTYEILPRLPIKSLFRLRLVCKKWCRLIIDDPLFIAYQFQKSTDHYSYLYRRDSPDERLNEISIDDHREFQLSAEFVSTIVEKNSDFFSSSNGLLCGISSGSFFVCNPITKHVKHIPNPNGRTFAALSFDPSPNSNPLLGCCRLVCWIIGCIIGIERQLGFEVFSSKRNNWRQSNAKLQVSAPHMFKDKNVFIGDKLYWIDVENIAWFDVEQDVAGLFPTPCKKKGVFMKDSSLEACKGELRYNNMTADGEIEIWLMRNRSEIRRSRGESEFYWVKTYTVGLQEVIEDNWKDISSFYDPMELSTRNAPEANYFRRHLFSPLGYHGGEMVLFWIIIKWKKRNFSFNFRTREFKMMRACEILNLKRIRSCPYKPSLLRYPS